MSLKKGFWKIWNLRILTLSLNGFLWFFYSFMYGSFKFFYNIIEKFKNSDSITQILRLAKLISLSFWL